MAKKNEENEELIVDVQEVYSKTETFIDQNKSGIIGVVAVIVIAIGSYLAYNNLHLNPLQEEASKAMFMAEKSYFKDSLNLAINGNSEFAGFIEIADEYGSTKAGNLANFYLGVSFLKMGEYKNALQALKNFDGDDEMLGTTALGAQGDAYLELEDYDQAIEYYEKAANRKENEFSTPYHLMKAGKTYELKGDYTGAVRTYEIIKNNWKKSPEASDVDKYIARANTAGQ